MHQSGRKGQPVPCAARGTGRFVIANAWDAGSARILTGVGFVALATSSGAAAGMLGRRDGAITRDESLAHARAVVEATDLPVSADLEKGFGDAPADAALTIRMAGEIGLVGGSIEDATGNAQKPLFDAGLRAGAHRRGGGGGAGDAVSVHADGARGGFPSRQSRSGRHDQAAAGIRGGGRRCADGAGPADLAAVRTVCSALSKPFNFMAGIKGKSFSVPELAEAGVKRISLATSLYRAAMTGLLNAAREVKEKGRSATSIPRWRRRS